jgi:subtilisin family serine protease
LDRIDKEDASQLDDTFSYDDTQGELVDSYIIDTGILITHNDFGGRATWGQNFAGDGQNTDCNGHGTHVAGTVGGTRFGVAKKTTLIAVKVLTCSGSGSYAGVINGINWAAGQSSKRRSVANMSLGGLVSNAVNEAVDNAVASGLVMVVAAGNDRSDACKYSPASAKSAITVGATYTDSNSNGDQIDERASFSNFGECVKVLAPGQGIDSAYIGNPQNSATRILSGTSMASPHVAGVAALWMGMQKDAPSPAQVLAFLEDNAQPGKIDMSCSGLSALCMDTPNLMLHLVCQA